jgi:ATP-binding cassette subfamily B (MDR/TAP) protein 6
LVTEEPVQEEAAKEEPPAQVKEAGDDYIAESNATPAVAFPSANDEPEATAEPEVKPAESNEGAVGPSSDAPLAFPSNDTPLSFPSSDDKPSSAPSPPPMQSPGVTFGDVSATPDRVGTPDPEAEPKRKRISSQNFQRLARRISISGKRQGSTSSIPVIANFPGFRRDSPRGSTDTGSNSVTTPAASTSQDDKKDKKDKKEKKDRKSTK